MRTNLLCCFVLTPHCRDVLNELLAVDEHVVKDKFINAYVEVTNSYPLLRCTCAVSFNLLNNLFKITKNGGKPIDNEPRRGEKV